MSKEDPWILCTDCYIDPNNLYETKRTEEEEESDQENEWKHLILKITFLTYLMTRNSPILSFYTVLALSFCFFLVKKC